MSSRILSAYLVDDEPMCRADFRQILQAFPEIRLIGETDNLPKARAYLESRSVDLLFLDLSVGREHGLDLVEQLARPPMVIALTAHPQHAARGFTLNLVDYILKPVEADRLRSALEKARHRLAAAPLQPGRVTFVAEMDRKKTVLELEEVLGAESMGNYVLLHTTRGKAVKRTTFRHVKAKLPSSLYLQVNRGRILARRSIREWGRDTSRHLILHLAGGETVTVSRSLSSRVMQVLEEKSPG